MRTLHTLTAVVLTLWVASARADTPNTATAAPGAARPAATLADATFLEGHWLGTGLGGVAEEMWSPPAAGAMMGVFRSVREGKVFFYEILLVAEEEGSLTLKLKHFDAALKGWEEKDEVRSFPLVRKAADELWFSSITLRREGDVLRCFVAIRHGEGKVVEEPFEMRRVGG